MGDEEAGSAFSILDYFTPSTEVFSPWFPRCHVAISHVNTFDSSPHNLFTKATYFFDKTSVLATCFIFFNCVCTRQVLLLINAA